MYPNSSSPTQDPSAATATCSPCLFDVGGDPTEQHDVAAQYPEVVGAMTARLATLAAGSFSNNDTGLTPMCPPGTAGDCACWVVRAR
jgi:hypothetical protein